MQGCLHWLLLGLLPGLEPRYAVLGLQRCLGDTVIAVALAAAEAAVLAAVLALLVEHLWGLLLRLAGRLPWLRGLVARVEAARSRVEQRAQGIGAEAALALFVAAPLPVTGIYTGAAVALLLGVPRRRAAAALAAGGVASVLITGLLGGAVSSAARG